jgi:hypothetical protein
MLRSICAHRRRVSGLVIPIVAKRHNASISQTQEITQPLNSILIANRGEIALLVLHYESYHKIYLTEVQTSRENSLETWNQDNYYIYRSRCPVTACFE